ncbi:hypothetical protein [Bacillus cereus]|uniref:hypothetical protein n=1 Tax=Bacillus cereus TaxID=1396 RepID=UPI0015D49DF4|nr:hypothetical protein [Bacillus cereus]
MKTLMRKLKGFVNKKAGDKSLAERWDMLNRLLTTAKLLIGIISGLVGLYLIFIGF